MSSDLIFAVGLWSACCSTVSLRFWLEQRQQNREREARCNPSQETPTP